MATCSNFVFRVLFLASSLLAAPKFTLAYIDLHIKPPQNVIYLAVGSPLNLKCLHYNTSSNISLEWVFKSERYVQLSHGYNVSTLEVNMSQISYNNSGTFTCIAKVSSCMQQVEKSVKLIVGDSPPVPPNLVLEHLYGYPPVAGWMAYTLPTSPSSAYPMNIKMLLACASMSNSWCIDLQNPGFHLVEEINQTLSNKTEQLDFRSNLTSALKRLSLKYNSDGIHCDVLCAALKITNRFGCKFHFPPKLWNIQRHVECGAVEDLKILQTSKRSIKVGWNSSKYLRIASLQTNPVFYYLECTPNCGSPVRKVREARRPQRFTISELLPYTEYVINITCSLFDRQQQSHPATITVWTEQDVPLSAPTIEDVKWIQVADNRGTALIIWKELKDDSILRGKLQSYRVTVENLDDQSIKPMTEEVPAGNTSLKIPGLPMANRRFAICACTEAGCSNQSFHIFKASNFTGPDKNDDGGKNNEVVENGQTVTMVALITSLVIFVFVTVMIIWCYCKTHSRNDLPKVNIQFETNEGNKSQEPEQPNVYSSINPAFSTSTIDLKTVEGDSSNPSTSSRSSTSSTSSTIL